MTNSQTNCLHPSALLQRSWRAALLLVLASSLTLTTSCRYDDDKCCEPTLKGKIISYNEFGAATIPLIPVSASPPTMLDCPKNSQD